MNKNASEDNCFYSQYGQDAYVYSTFFKGKKDGFFVEIGADDGVDKSNTLFFEKLGWKGICVEPSPVRFKSLQKNRRCLLINKAIHSEKREFDFVDIVGYGKGLSGIVDNYHPKHLKRMEEETTDNEKTISKSYVKVSAIPLSEVLEANKVSHIDYLSIDVEGGEKEVLKSIDFEKVVIDVIVVENNYGDQIIKDYLVQKGFSYFANVGIDEVFVSKRLKKKRNSIFSKLFN